MLVFKLSNTFGVPLIKGSANEMYFTNIGKAYDFLSELLGFNILTIPIIDSPQANENYNLYWQIQANETKKRKSFRMKIPNNGNFIENMRYVLYYDAHLDMTFVIDIIKLN